MSKCACCNPCFHLVTLFGEERGQELYAWLVERLAALSAPPDPEPLDQRDVILIEGADGQEQELAGVRLHTMAAIVWPDDLDETGVTAMVEALLEHVRRGRRFIHLKPDPRPDGYHHLAVQFLRAILDESAPYVALVVESRLPQSYNFAYFGNGYNEASLVHNLALPPLALHAYTSGSAARLREWAVRLSLPSTQVSFFNLLEPAGGIQFAPAEGFLTDLEIEQLAERTLASGGQVEHQTLPDGTTSPAGLQAACADVLADPEYQEPGDRAQRLFGVHAVLLALAGIPGIGEQDVQGETLLPLLQARRSSPAFAPFGPQLVVDAGDPIFGLLRFSLSGQDTVLCLHNVTGAGQRIHLNLAHIGLPGGIWTDLISGRRFDFDDPSGIIVEKYGAVWLKMGEM